MHSDGLSSKWDLASYPGLGASHPSADRRRALPRPQARARRRLGCRDAVGPCAMRWGGHDADAPARLRRRDRRETDIILARQRARKVADLLGFDSQDQTRITTAVSEIVRNALEYGGGGLLEFHPRGAGRRAVAGHRHLATRAPGSPISTPSWPAHIAPPPAWASGITGARRLMDRSRSRARPAAAPRSAWARTCPGRGAPPRRRPARRDRRGADPAGQPRPDPRNPPPEPGISAAAGGAAPGPGASWSSSTRNCRTPIAASSRSTPSSTTAPTICAAPTS